MNHAKDFVEQVGAIHVHSTYSDGAGDIERILSAARAAEADFVLLTDHDTTAARREGWAGTHDGVTLIVAAETTPAEGPHSLALGVGDCLGLARLGQEEYLEKVERAGGFVAIAHPLGMRRPELGVHHRAWTAWDHRAVRAVEIWNYMHNLVDQFLPWRLREAYRLLMRPRAHISAPDAQVLAIWDRLARKRGVAGISGLDCHTFSVPLTRLELFPYEDLFATVRTHVLAPPSFAGASEGSPATAETKEQVLLEAIRQSRCFVANDYVADARGTRYWAECACGAMLSMGDRHFCRGRATLRVSLPRAALIRIICDGRPVAERQASSLDAPADASGVYRVEAHLDGKPWIFTNHIALLSAKESGEASACPTN